MFKLEERRRRRRRRRRKVFKWKVEKVKVGWWWMVVGA